MKSIAAVNTAIFDGPEIVGYNTDYNAAMDCLEHALGEIGADPESAQGKAGARPRRRRRRAASVFGLRKRGATITIASRTMPRAERLANTFEAKAIDWEARHRGPCDVIVNCTPIGMHPNVDESPIQKTFLKPNMLVFDTVYNPESTLLIKDARSPRCETITGVEMFVRQAQLQFFLFTRQEAPADLMRDVLKRAIGPVKYFPPQTESSTDDDEMICDG